MNDIVIREANQDDIRAIADIESICFNEYEATTYQDFKDRYHVFPEWFLIAEYHDQIIGFINGGSTNDYILKDELYHDASLHLPCGVNQCIYGIDVLPQYQGHGVAHLLLNHYIDLARNRKKKAVILTCKDYLISFYQSFGFTHAGRSLSHHGGAEWNDMILYL